MINTFIAYDDNDFELGQYFEDSHSDISSLIVTNPSIKSLPIRGLDCTETNINAILAPFEDSRFIFIALCHGNCDEFVSNDIFISSANAPFFKNSFFYSTACSTGKNLGKIIIDNGCHSFIGYEEEVTILEDYSKDFYSCENYGIKSFLMNDETIDLSFKKMVDFYTQKIEDLLAGSMDDLIAASYLISNRDCLVFLGEDKCKSLTRNDFMQ